MAKDVTEFGFQKKEDVIVDLKQEIIANNGGFTRTTSQDEIFRCWTLIYTVIRTQIRFFARNLFIFRYLYIMYTIKYTSCDFSRFDNDIMIANDDRITLCRFMAMLL